MHIGITNVRDRLWSMCEGTLTINIIAALWEDAGDSVKKSSYLRDLRADLLTTFSVYCVEEAVRKQRGMIAVTRTLSSNGFVPPPCFDT